MANCISYPTYRRKPRGKSLRGPKQKLAGSSVAAVFEEPAEGCVCTHRVIPKPQLSRVVGNEAIEQRHPSTHCSWGCLLAKSVTGRHAVGFSAGSPVIALNHSASTTVSPTLQVSGAGTPMDFGWHRFFQAAAPTADGAELARRPPFFPGKASGLGRIRQVTGHEFLNS